MMLRLLRAALVVKEQGRTAAWPRATWMLLWDTVTSSARTHTAGQRKEAVIRVLQHQSTKIKQEKRPESRKEQNMAKYILRHHSLRLCLYDKSLQRNWTVNRGRSINTSNNQQHLCHLAPKYISESKKSSLISRCVLSPPPFHLRTAKQTWYLNWAPLLKCSQQLNKHLDHTAKDHMKYVRVIWRNKISCLLSYSFPKTTCLVLLSWENRLYQYIQNEHDKWG